jgi:diacylglycerol kinase (ATP)
MRKKGKRSTITRARDSLRGLSEGWRRERALRTHVLVSLVGLSVLAVADVDLSWWLAVFLLVVAGISAELVNGSIEALLDRLHSEHHPEVGAAKDMASAAAFVINAAAAALFAAALLT